MEFSREGVTLRPPTEDDCQFLADLGNNMRTQGWNQRLPPIRVPEIISERMKEGLKKPYKAMFMIDTEKDGRRSGTSTTTRRSPGWVRLSV